MNPLEQNQGPGWEGEYTGVANTDDSALLKGGLSVWFQGMPAPEPRAGTSPSLSMHSPLQSPSWLMYLHPPSPGEEGGWQRLQGFCLSGALFTQPGKVQGLQLSLGPLSPS